ncbi:MAG: hypothetical protein K2Z81_19040, partial [Cyanobacteria bacterium]|nr:hypothetical protein [Cyanobacteriota bacterium]
VVVALLLTQTPKVGTAGSTEAAPHEKPNLPVTTKSTVESGNVVNQDASKNLSGQRSSVKSSQRPSRPRTKSISNADHAKKASKPAIKASKPAIKARHIPNEVQSVHHVDKAKPQSKPSVVKAGNPWDKLKSRLSNEAKNDSE